MRRSDHVMAWLDRPCPLARRFTRLEALTLVLAGISLLVVVAITVTPVRAQVPFAIPEGEPRVIRHVYPAPPYAAQAQPISPYRAEQFRSLGPVIPLEPSMSPYRREQLGLRSDPATASPYRRELWRSGRR